MKKLKRILAFSLVLCLAASFLCFPLGEKAQAAVGGCEALPGDKVTYLDSNTTKTTLSDAFTDSVPGQRHVLVIRQKVSLSDLTDTYYSFGANTMNGTENVVVTAFYDGVDYRPSGAMLELGRGNVCRYVFRCNVTFTYVKISHVATDNIFVCMGKNVEFGDGFENAVSSTKIAARPILITGYDKNLTATSSFSGKQTVRVTGGEWQYVRGGDRRSNKTHAFTDYSGQTDIVIDGGHFFAASTDATTVQTVSVTAQMSSRAGSRVRMTINDGIFEGPIYAFGYSYDFSTAPSCEVNASLVIRGGEFRSGVIRAVQCTSGSYRVTPNGKFTLVVTGGTFTSPAFSGANAASRAFYASSAVAEGAFSDFSVKGIADANGPVTFVDETVTNGDGLSVDTAFSSLGDAASLLADGGVGGTIVLCGRCSVEDEELPDVGGTLYFTGRYNSTDYRSPKYARLRIKGRLTLNNDVNFTNFDFCVSSGVCYLELKYHDMTAGTGVRMRANYNTGSMTTNQSEGKLLLIGGYYVPGGTARSDAYDDVNVDQEILLSSGTYLGVRCGNHRVSNTSAFGLLDGKVNVTISGVTFNNTVAATNPLAHVGIEGAGENTVLPGYRADITINSGTISSTDCIGFARKGNSYAIPACEGHITFTINGGTFTSSGIYSYDPDTGTLPPVGEFIVHLNLTRKVGLNTIDGTMGKNMSSYGCDPYDPSDVRSGISELYLPASLLDSYSPIGFSAIVVSDGQNVLIGEGTGKNAAGSGKQTLYADFSALKSTIENGFSGAEAIEFGVYVEKGADDGVGVSENDPVRGIAKSVAYREDMTADLLRQNDSTYTFRASVTDVPTSGAAGIYTFTAYARFRTARGVIWECRSLPQTVSVS